MSNCIDISGEEIRLLDSDFDLAGLKALVDEAERVVNRDNCSAMGIERWAVQMFRPKRAWLGWHPSTGIVEGDGPYKAPEQTVETTWATREEAQAALVERGPAEFSEQGEDGRRSFSVYSMRVPDGHEDHRTAWWFLCQPALTFVVDGSGEITTAFWTPGTGRASHTWRDLIGTVMLLRQFAKSERIMVRRSSRDESDGFKSPFMLTMDLGSAGRAGELI